MHNIVDRIYEAAALPELWPGVLSSLSTEVNAVGSLIIVAGGAERNYVTSPALTELAPKYFANGYQLVDERTRRLFQRNEAGFLTDLDVFTAEEWEADPIRRDFWAPVGMGWGVATRIAAPTVSARRFHSGDPGAASGRQRRHAR